MVKNNVTRRAALGGIVGAAVAPHAAAAQLARDQAGNMVEVQRIFVDLTLADAEAATAEGQLFKLIDSAAGTAAVYQRTASGSDELYQEATAGALASPHSDKGAAMVGFKQNAASTVPRTMLSKAQDIFNAKDFGVVADGSTDDTDALNLAIEALYQDFGGGTLQLPAGQVRINAPLLWRTGVSIFGFSAQTRQRGTVSKIVSDSSDLIHHGDVGFYGAEMSNVELTSDTGGGHIFKVLAQQSRTHIHNVGMYQRNPDKCILHAVIEGGSGYFGNWWEKFNAEYASNNSVPAFLIEADNTINHNVFRDFRLGRPSISKGGTYAFDIHNKTASIAANVNLIEQGTFQQPGGGAVRFRGLRESVIRQCGIWDLFTGSSEPLFYFGAGDGGQQNARCGLDQVMSNVRAYDNESIDCYIEPNSYLNLFINYSQLGRLVGGDTNGSQVGVLNRGSLINVVEDISMTTFSHRNGYDRRQPGAAINRFRQMVGYPGGNDGFVRWLVNEGYVGGFNADGDLLWGGMSTAPNFRVSPDGLARAREFHDIATGAKIVWGSGDPNGSVSGVPGSIYLNTSGGAGATLYVKETGGSGNTGWVAK